jgi:type IV secretory pathway VirB2 component (pilin)
MSSAMSSSQTQSQPLNEQQVEVFSQFRQRVRATLSFFLAPIMLIAVCAMLWWTQSRMLSELELVVEIVKWFIVADVFFVLYMWMAVWRCPLCNKFLGNNINPKYCKCCGVQLRE